MTKSDREIEQEVRRDLIGLARSAYEARAKSVPSKPILHDHPSVTHIRHEELAALRADIERLTAKLAERDSGLTNWYQAAIERATRIEQLEAEIERLSTALLDAAAALEARTDENERLRELIGNADSMLSLIRHRGSVRWGGIGFVESYEVDHLIGELRAAFGRDRYTKCAS